MLQTLLGVSSLCQCYHQLYPEAKDHILNDKEYIDISILKTMVHKNLIAIQHSFHHLLFGALKEKHYIWLHSNLEQVIDCYIPIKNFNNPTSSGYRMKLMMHYVSS